ncbi:MAG: hypothetical protein U0787_02940 [Polyangia bacterium]
MSVSHLAKVSPSQLGFVRAFLWQLARTGQVSESAVEQQAAVDAARLIFSISRSRDELWRFFGEFRQLVESGNDSALSDALRAVLTPAAAQEPVPAEVPAPVVEAVEKVEAPAPVVETSAKAEVLASVPPAAMSKSARRKQAKQAADAQVTPTAAPPPATDSVPAQVVESASSDDAPMATAGDTPDDEGGDASNGPSAHVIHGSDAANETT